MSEEIIILERLLPMIFELAFYLVTLFFLVFSLIFCFHWFSYSTNKAASTIALAVYLGGSALCFIIMSGSLLLM